MLRNGGEAINNYTKTLNHRKIFRNTKKITTTENEKNTKTEI